MANVISNPIVIDTPGSGLIYNGEVKVQAFRWISASAVAGHGAIVKDRNDITKWESVASGPNYEDVDHLEFSFNGLKVTALGSGVLYIYLR